MRVLGVSEVARGTANNMGVHLRDIYRSAIVLGAVYVIVAHNHPSGILNPSKADIRLTRECVKAGSLLGIDVIDHLIVTGSGFYSFSDAGNTGISKYDFYSVNEPNPPSRPQYKKKPSKRKQPRYSSNRTIIRISKKGTDFFGKKGFEISGKRGDYTAHINPYLKKHKNIKAGTLKAPTLDKLESKLDMLIESLN